MKPEVIFDCCPKRLGLGKPEIRKRVLYYSPSRKGGSSLIEDIAKQQSVAVEQCEHPVIGVAGLNLCWVMASDLNHAREVLDARYVNLLLFDLRVQPDIDHSAAIEEVMRFLTDIDDVSDIETRYGFHRIMVLVSGEDPDAVDQLIARLGAAGVGRVLQERRRCQEGQERAFAERVMEEVVAILKQGRRGKRALCTSGGGVTGLYFELGALKCLSDVLGPHAINEFDMYFGISAGAVVGGLLAAGYSVDELMASLSRRKLGRIPPFSFRLFSREHFDFSGLHRRLWRTWGSAMGTLWDIVQGRKRLNADSLFLDYSDVLGPVFHSHGFERMMRVALSHPRASNDFRELRRPLFVGASDVDTKRHVLFGPGRMDDVPISKAIQASLSFNPAFAPVQIQGRYYEDGAVTRTSNIAEAIRRGADLIFVIDPFVPYVAKRPGFAARRGLLYNIDQDLRTVTYTRFETSRNWILRENPEVSSYTFLPSNRLRKLLSINPMDHRPALEIWRGAYLSTLDRVRHLIHRMRGDLLCHGLALRLDIAEQVEEQLRRSVHLRFEDFYPDQKVEIPMPPLVKDQVAFELVEPAVAEDVSPGIRAAVS